MSLEKTSSEETPSEEASSVEKGDDLLPRAVQVAYMRPLKRTPTHGLPVCDLQLRSYSVRNVEFMADFALRAAYYLKLPASGPVPLPKLVKRWTVPRSNFAHKKSQENFERVTLRRLIQIKDANPETVQIWLAYLRKHAFHGVGMKANIWHHEKLGRFRAATPQAMLIQTQRSAQQWMQTPKISKRRWNRPGACSDAAKTSTKRRALSMRCTLIR